MKIILSLSSEQLRSIENILGSLSEQAQQSLSLKGLLESWKSFVERVEQGYQNSIYEYTNDLSTRDLLQKIVLGVSSTVRSELLKVLEPWDDKFYGATREIVRPLLPGPHEEKLNGWWFRVPHKMGDDLKNDLLADEIIQ